MPRYILVLAILLFVLNVFDAGATTYLLTTGIGYEANPIMAWLINQGIGWFWAFKISMAGVVSCFFARVHRFKLARLALWVATITYGLLAVYYIIGFIFLL